LLHDVDPLLPSRHEVAVIPDDLREDVRFHFGLPDVVSAAANRDPMAATSRQADAMLRQHHSSHLLAKSSSLSAIAESTCARFRELDDRRTRGGSVDISTRAQ
jgi:hypothetical protein